MLTKRQENLSESASQLRLTRVPIGGPPPLLVRDPPQAARDVVSATPQRIPPGGAPEHREMQIVAIAAIGTTKGSNLPLERRPRGRRSFSAAGLFTTYGHVLDLLFKRIETPISGGLTGREFFQSEKEFTGDCL